MKSIKGIKTSFIVKNALQNPQRHFENHKTDLKCFSETEKNLQENIENA